MSISQPRSGPRRRFGPAEAVADELRQRILGGEHYDDGFLPKIEDLTAEFGVSTTAIREACRILETEGLISVRRGNQGGSIVHRPSPANVAYTVGLVLQARRVEMPDVFAAIERFEPMCAELCAERADRHETVVPALRRAQDALRAANESGDGTAATAAAREWHEALVATCGNETVEVLLGALLGTIRAHVATEAEEFRARGVAPSPELIQRTLDEHDRVQELIEEGDGPGAMAAARSHLRTARIHPADGAEYTSVVRADAIRDGFVG